MTETIARSAHDVERRKRERYATLVLVELPRLRCVGFAFLSLGVYLNNRFLLGQTSLHDWAVISIVMAVYAAVAWGAQILFYTRFAIDLTFFLLIADLPLWIVALYFSGAERSWLFFILFMRFADQTQTTFRRCLGFVSFGTFCYAAMLAWVALVDARPLDAGSVVAKLSFIFFGGVYIALSAKTAESRRVHLAEAMHTQRELIGMLEEQSVELRDARARAEEASAAKSEFLANMSHEMRTPLHGVLGMLQLAIDGERSPERGRQLEMARRSAEGLLGTIEGILDFSRIEARRVDLEPIYFSIRELVTDTVKALAVSAAEKGLAISFGVNPAVPDRLWGDPMRLRQILVNLLGNAIKFTASGEIVVRVWCDEPEGNDLRVRFEVRDTGIGIEVTKQGRIFEPFEQAEGTRARRFGGTGLGLSIVSRLVEVMGGMVDLESERGKGTVFRFDVLLAADEIAGDVAPEWERALAGTRVVVVEPNPTARAFDGDMLRAHGFV
ncbi:MAG TPA: ATP-binding protein, partial [Thermoanaerobaculia bacterium]|nr:ATP-binding protein [Thermoanaerobaculia bacterium]